MPRDNTLRARLNEHFHYDRGLSFCDILDAFTYVNNGRFFITADGRLARVWKLGTYPADVLTPAERLYVANGMARVIDQYPEGSSGQIMRFTHRDVTDVVSRYLENSKADGFARDLIDAVVNRQLDGAAHGFFADIGTDEIATAREALMRETSPDGDTQDAMFQRVERSMTTGRYALVTDLYLIFLYVPSWMRLGHMGISVIKKLLGGVGLVDLPSEYKRVFEMEKGRFLRICTDIEAKAANAGLAPASINGQALLNVLYRELNPERSLTIPPPTYRQDYTIREQLDIARDPKVPDIAQQATYSTLTTSNEGWKIDGVHYKVVSAKSLPNDIAPGMLSDVASLIDGEHWAVINFSVPKQSRIRAALKLRRQAVDNTNQAQFMDHPLFRGDPKLRAEKADDIDEAVYATNVENKDRMKVIDASVHVLLKNRNVAEVDEMARKVTDLMWNAGFFEKNRGDAMVHQCLPLNFRPAASGLIARDLRCLSMGAADLAPLFTSYGGVDSPGMLVNNEHGQPIFIDIFATRASHGFIQGSTGSGKSYLFNNILLQLQKYSPKVFLVDKGESYLSLCQGLGGAYIRLGFDEVDGKAPICINPFYTVPNTKLSNEDLEFMRGIIVAMMESGSKNENVDKEDINTIMDAIKKVFDERTKAGNRKEVVLTDIYECLMQHFGDAGKNIALRFKEYTRGYPYGAVFDGPLGLDWENDFIVLEVQRMAASPALPVAMLALFQQIRIYCMFKLPPSRYKILAVDEAWNALSSPTTATAIAGFFREMRKYKCGVLLISQAVNDLRSIVSSDTSSTDGILVNLRHLFFMPSSVADHKAAKEIFNLQEPEIEAWRNLASLPPFYTECFYRYIDNRDRPISGKFRLYSTPLALWTATTDPDDKELRDPLFREYARRMPEDQARGKALHELAAKYPRGARYHKANSRNSA
jgi:hypothetical protein